MATEAQLANLAKAREARAAKRALRPAHVHVEQQPDPESVAGAIYDRSIESMILTMREQLNTVADKVEVLWLERGNAVASRRFNEPYEITYRCTECGTLVEALHPKFRISPDQAVRCPNPIHNGGLTPMDYTP